jgi:hypothetical protein
MTAARKGTETGLQPGKPSSASTAKRPSGNIDPFRRPFFQKIFRETKSEYGKQF